MAAPAGARRRGAVQLARFGADPLAYLDGARALEGDVLSTRLGSKTVHLVRRPELIHAALVDEDWPPFSRGRLMALDKWYSGGLILTEGAEHHRQRDTLWKPLLEDPRTLEVARERTERWAGEIEGTIVELFSASRAHVWGIDWAALTGEELTPELLRAQEAGVAALVWLLGPFGPRRWSTPAGARTRAARRRLDAAIDVAIAARRAQPAGDLLSRLVALEPDDQTVQATVKQWLGADQLMGIFTWGLHLLARHPEIEARWHASLDAGDTGYTVRVIKETLRLFPPVWSFFREVTADYRLGDHVIPEGDLLVLSPYFTHRDETVWEEPLRFDPDRWDVRPAPGAYFPFSAGPYECHAHDLAMREAVLILTTLGRRLRFKPMREDPPRPLATGAIVPKGGLRMRVLPRG
ncbi:cytochrome P450 [Candidatus Solirubrobacter pratensis]|uniref:cytochrome P450 n=1 Tax=Candidatus Solirubrobacter pratensis TaxID=1298857 RepID=UPI0004855C65|nr:cytochrome P450 [Candidatus Solirubrobacter pratensis]